MDSGEQHRRNRLACLVEFFAECERFYGIASETGRQQVVEKVAQGGVGVVCPERNFRPLHRKTFPAVRLDGHDECRRDEHGDNPGGHADVPVTDDFVQRNSVEDIGKPTNTYEKLDDSLGKKPLACIIGRHAL